MKYKYQDLSPEQFEVLITLLCQELLGISVQGFATGKDGGRDAKFEGTAELHPSRVDPWKGKVVIQAKHTNGFNCSFSDSDFYSNANQNTVIGKELPRIKNLRKKAQLDYYMLFSNRRLTSNAEAEIRKIIAEAAQIPENSVYLCGIEQLELLLKKYPRIIGLANLDPIDSPLVFSPEELSEVVEALAGQGDHIWGKVDTFPVKRISYEDKNELNNMSEDYAKALRRNYLKDTDQIRGFLASPENRTYLSLYESVVEELELKIIAHRKDFQLFDKVMNYIFDLLFKRDAVLRRNKRLTRAVVFYMYWNCDIGDEGDDSTD